MKTLVVTAGLITEGGRIVVAQRKEGDEWGLFWEFPGGTLEEDEGPHECIKRELREELGIGVEIGDIQQVVFRQYERFNILLLAYQCRIRVGIPTAIGCREVRWVGKEELKELQMPPADEVVRGRLLHGGLWDLDAV
jgi:8-oxo-dGTP diphosphatase